MTENLIQDRHFENTKPDQRFWEKDSSIYENCVFSGCNFNKSSLTEIKFYDCRFENCDLSLADVHRAIFQEVEFLGCRLSGVLFDRCNPFALELRFYDSKLDHSSFSGLKLTKAVFQECSLKGVDFSAAGLKEAIFKGSDLLDATFEQTNLEKADFSAASRYRISPEHNKIKGAVFSSDGLAGLLADYKIRIVP